MDFNKLVKSIVEPTLLNGKFVVDRETNGCITYKHKPLRISFVYDSQVSYEMNMYLAFEKNDISYDYSLLQTFFYNSEFSLKAVQTKEEGFAALWLEGVKLFLEDYLAEIVDNSGKLQHELAKLQQAWVEKYAREREISRLSEAVNKYWQAKDYVGLVTFLEGYDKPIEGMIKVKYDYAAKACRKI